MTERNNRLGGEDRLCTEKEEARTTCVNAGPSANTSDSNATGHQHGLRLPLEWARLAANVKPAKLCGDGKRDARRAVRVRKWGAA